MSARPRAAPDELQGAVAYEVKWTHRTPVTRLARQVYGGLR